MWTIGKMKQWIALKKSITGKKIWVSVDETTDVEGKFITNVIAVGILLVDGLAEIFLLTSSGKG